MSAGTAMQRDTERQPLVGEQRFLLTDISWNFYLAFCEELGERRIRLSYDRGGLEIMITKAPHEFFKKMLAKLVEATLDEFEIPVRSGGSMTFQREDLQKGFEPDESWWIAHEADVRGKSEFDFLNDPPPDLAIEVEISSSRVDRVGIYAAMGVRELWRHDGSTLRFYRLGDTGEYEAIEHSVSFPFLSPADVLPFLREDVDETTQLRRFRDWLRRVQR